MQILNVNSDWFLGLLRTAKKELVLVFPAMHADWLTCLERIAQEKEIRIQICINNTEESIRKGHGSALQFEKLTDLKAELRQSKNLKVQYLRCDDYAYFFFNDSMIISEWGLGENAVQLSATNTREFEKSIFPDAAIAEMLPYTQSNQPILSEPFDQDDAKEAAVSLQFNPPLVPDLQRQLLVYTTRFQFVEIEFKGSKFASTKVKLPERVLPVNDADLLRSLETTLRLFQDRSNLIFQTSRNLIGRLDDIKRAYLRKNPEKDKWVLDKTTKLELNSALDMLQAEINKEKTDLINSMRGEIEITKQKLKSELVSFYLSNTPSHLKMLGEAELIAALEKLSTGTLDKIKFPDPSKLLDNLELVVHYFNLTEEDLRDKAVIQWFINQGLLMEEDKKQLAAFSIAYYAS